MGESAVGGVVVGILTVIEDWAGSLDSGEASAGVSSIGLAGSDGGAVDLRAGVGTGFGLFPSRSAHDLGAGDAEGADGA